MSYDVPESTLTKQELGKIANFRRDLANALDEALADGADDSDVTALSSRVTVTEADIAALELVGTGKRVYKATAYGDLDTPANIRTTLNAAALAASNDGGGDVLLPGGEYTLDRDGANIYMYDWPYSNVNLIGERGRTVIKAAAGQAATTVAMIRVDSKENVHFEDVIFDGNWGNAVTYVGKTAGGLSYSTLSTVASVVYVQSTDGFPSSGTFNVLPYAASTYEVVTYTSKTATTFVGCTIAAGTKTLFRNDPLVWVNSNENGINHTGYGPGLANPSLHGVMSRGSKNISYTRCKFFDIYGDGVWLGLGADDDTHNRTQYVLFDSCEFDLIARDGVSFSSGASDVEIRSSKMRNVHNACIDAETQYLTGQTPNIYIHHNTELRGWPTAYQAQFIIECTAGYPAGLNRASAALGWRIDSNVIYGVTHIKGAIAGSMTNNTVYYSVQDAAVAYAPIYIVGANDNFNVDGNTVYDWGAKSVSTSEAHNGAIHITHVPGGSAANFQPGALRVRNNTIHARNGLHGIWVNSQGHGTYGATGAVVASVTGTATSVVENGTTATLADTSKTWVLNQFKGWTVRIGNVHALVKSNTAGAGTSVLTLEAGVTLPGTAEPYAWRHWDGSFALAPAAGTYYLYSPSGFLDIDGNHIDCGADGNAKGGAGIYLFNDRAGGRMSVTNNKIKNADNWGIVVAGDTPVPVAFLELRGNRAWDDQNPQTTSAAIRFVNEESLTSIGKLIMADNGQGGGAAVSAFSCGDALTGTGAKWLEADGVRQEWTGYGVPAHAAPIGSTYVNLDGTGANSLYVNTDGGTTWSAR